MTMSSSNNFQQQRHIYAKCCNEGISSRPKPIWNSTQWYDFQQKYRSVVDNDESKSSESSSSSTIISPSSNNNKSTGFLVPYEVRNTNDKGRGVFATSIIPMGTKVWEPILSATFTGNGQEEFMKFLSLLDFHTACDVIDWSYVEDICSNDPHVNIDDDYTWYDKCYKCSCDLDEATLMNTVSSIDEIPTVAMCRDLPLELQHKTQCYKDCIITTNTENNNNNNDDDKTKKQKKEKELIGCDVEKNGGTSLWSIRDIQINEEFIVNYDDFHIVGGLPWYDSLWNIANWNEYYCSTTTSGSSSNNEL